MRTPRRKRGDTMADRNKYTPSTLPLETKQDVKTAIARFTRQYANGHLSEEQSRVLCTWLRLQLEALKTIDEDRIVELEKKVANFINDGIDLNG